MAEEIEGKGFVIRDRRTSAKTDEQIAEESKRHDEAEEAQRAAASREPEREPPEAHQVLPVDFSTFVLSLSSSAMIQFGQIPDPVSQRKRKNLAAARQTIEIIAMLQEKTRGNLEEHEQRLVDNVLYELRMRYVHEVEGKG